MSTIFEEVASEQRAPQSSLRRERRRVTRPPGVAAVAILLVLIGLIILAPHADVAVRSSYFAGWTSDPGEKLAYFLTALLAFVPPWLLLLTAHGLLHGRGWARWGTPAALGLSLASLIFVQYLLLANSDLTATTLGARFVRTVTLDLAGAVPIIAGVAFYMTRPHVVAAFAVPNRSRDMAS